jgi:hypothetical protein
MKSISNSLVRIYRRSCSGRAGTANDHPAMSYTVARFLPFICEAAFPWGPPDSWEVMLDPALEGRVSLYPGGKGFFPIAQVAGGGSLKTTSPITWRHAGNFCDYSVRRYVFSSSTRG